MRNDAILDAANETFAKVVVEDVPGDDKLPAPSTLPSKAHQIGVLASVIIGAILMALSQLWNWITGG